MSNENSEPRAMPAVRRVVLLLVWPCLLGAFALMFVRASPIVVSVVFLFPVVAYVVTLRFIEPWLERRRRGVNDC